MPLHNPDEKMNEGQGLFFWTMMGIMTFGMSICMFGGYGGVPRHIGLGVTFLIVWLFCSFLVAGGWFRFFRNVYRKARKHAIHPRCK